MGDIDWLRGDGDEMTEADWNAPFAKSLGVFLNGQALEGVDERGERRTDDSFMILINAHPEPQPWTLPSAEWAERWTEILDTTGDGFDLENGPVRKAGELLTLQGCSVKVLIDRKG